jgi:HEAT repeat protein
MQTYGWLCLLTVGCSGGSSDALIEQLGHRDPQVRRSAIQALAEQYGDDAAIVPALEPVLSDPDMAVRLSAALALQRIDPGNESSRPVIIESLRAGHATMFLEVGRMGSDAEWAVPTLLKLLRYPQPQIRGLAARALGEIGVANDDVEAALEKRLRDEAPAVRRAAQRALDQIHGSPPTP